MSDIVFNRLAGLSVLVVEDESIVYYLFEDSLKQLGCASVWRARNVETARALLEQRQPDAAILDVNLNGELAYPVAIQLDELGIPIVFATGYDRRGMPPFWADRPLLEKPFTADALAIALDKALGNSEPNGHSLSE